MSDSVTNLRLPKFDGGYGTLGYLLQNKLPPPLWEVRATLGRAWNLKWSLAAILKKIKGFKNLTNISFFGLIWGQGIHFWGYFCD